MGSLPQQSVLPARSREKRTALSRPAEYLLSDCVEPCASCNASGRCDPDEAPQQRRVAGFVHSVPESSCGARRASYLLRRLFLAAQFLRSLREYPELGPVAY